MANEELKQRQRPESQRRSIGALVLREDGWAQLKPARGQGKVVTSPFGLAFCRLDVKVGTDEIACQLSKPIIRPPEKLNLHKHPQNIAVPIPLEIYTLLAILIYGLLSRILVRFLKILVRSR